MRTVWDVWRKKLLVYATALGWEIGSKTWGPGTRIETWHSLGVSPIPSVLGPGHGSEPVSVAGTRTILLVKTSRVSHLNGTFPKSVIRDFASAWRARKLGNSGTAWKLRGSSKSPGIAVGMTAALAQLQLCNDGNNGLFGVRPGSWPVFSCSDYLVIICRK